MRVVASYLYGIPTMPPIALWRTAMMKLSLGRLMLPLRVAVIGTALAMFVDMTTADILVFPFLN